MLAKANVSYSDKATIGIGKKEDYLYEIRTIKAICSKAKLYVNQHSKTCLRGKSMLLHEID